jgi:hypothetical protein
MFDPISVVAGAAAVLVGWLAGRVSRQPQAPKQAGALCSCDHGYGTHENGGQCHAQVERPHYWGNGSRNGYEWVPCPCLSYDGPEPLPRVWTP